MAMIVRDVSIIANDAWLRGLVAKLAYDERVADAYCRQILREDSYPFTRYVLKNDFANMPERRERVKTARACYQALLPPCKLTKAYVGLRFYAQTVMRSVYGRIVDHRLRRVV